MQMNLQHSTQNVLKKDSIASAPPLDISDLIQKTNDILDTTKGTMQNVEASADNLKTISTKINQGQGTIGALVNDKSIYRDASAGAAAFSDDMEALKHNFLLRGFFKKRGYEDSDELAKHAVGHLPSETPSKRFSFDATQLFDKPDSSKLKNKKVLKDAGEFLQDNKFGVAVVAARSGMKGDTDKVREQTGAQALVVRDYLVQNFRIDDTRVKTMGLGKSTDENESYKLEVLVYPTGSASVAEQSQR